jgi:hypothetical protein
MDSEQDTLDGDFEPEFERSALETWVLSAPAAQKGRWMNHDSGTLWRLSCGVYLVYGFLLEERSILSVVRS